MTVLGDLSADVDLNGSGGEVFPVGMILPFIGRVAPAGWSLCNGFEVMRDSPLGQKLGGRYGAGNGSSTYNKPNLVDRFPLGKGESGAPAALGNAGGALGHTHGPGGFAFASHVHGVGGMWMDDHGHPHDFYIGDHAHGLPLGNTAVMRTGDGSGGVMLNSGTYGSSWFWCGGGLGGSGSWGTQGTVDSRTPATVGESAASDPAHQVVSYIIKE